MSDCICGEINARNCPVHQGDTMSEKKEFWITDPYEYDEYYIHLNGEEAKDSGDYIIHVIDMESYRRLEKAYSVLREACQKVGGKELESWGAMYEDICEQALEKSEELLKDA